MTKLQYDTSVMASLWNQTSTAVVSMEDALAAELANEIRHEVDNHIIDQLILEIERKRIKQLFEDCDNIKPS